MSTAGWLSNPGIVASSLGVLFACDAKPEARDTPREPVSDAAGRDPIPPEPIRAPRKPDLASQQRESPTKLRSPGPSPQPFDDRPNPDGIETVQYASEGRDLKAWLHRGKPGKPVFVYLHGGFAAGAEEAFACPQFAEAGYTVLVPTYRGENGNPGSFELMFGEVRDAAAAVRYAQSLEGVDADRVVVFGHSIGAGTAALLAAMDDVPTQITGGAGGMYGAMAIESFLVDYGVAEPVGNELTLRTPSLMLESMRIRHHAFAGEGDEGAQLGAMLGWLQSKGAPDHPLRVYDVPGDHFESLAPACAAFFELAQGRASPVAARSPATLDEAGRDPALELYQVGAVWGEGPFGEAAGKPAAESKVVRLRGWQIEVPANAKLKTAEEDGLKRVMFETKTLVGELSVGRIPPEAQASYRPLHAAFDALMNVTPTAARFFFPSDDAVGLELRGEVRGLDFYVRMLATHEAAMTLTLLPPDDPSVPMVAGSLRPVAESSPAKP